MFRLAVYCLAVSGWLMVCSGNCGRIARGAETPLTAVQVADRINEYVRAGWQKAGIEPASEATDQEFVRRVYLDVAGRIPRVEEVETFLADGRADRRRRLIDHLTDSEDYVQHFADTFDAVLMGRGSEHDYRQRVEHGWRAFLEDAFRSNRSWHEVIRDIVVARPPSPERRGSVWFLYERKDKHQEIAEAISPAVFGLRIECAQCHDHPLADEILQSHYWGLVAFFNRGKNVKGKNGPRVRESAIGGFSEFADLTGDSHANRLAFFGAATVEEARPEKDVKQEDKDDLYRNADVDGDPRVPLFSRRQRFADDVVKDHPLVARSMVNRIWAMMMGRGVVHPFDEMDSVHRPSHPELIDWLTEDYRASGFDTRRLVRAIAMSQPYQLSSVRPTGADDPATFGWYLERPLTAEQLARSMQIVVRGEYRNDDRLVDQFRASIREVMPDESITTIKEALFLSNGEAINNFLEQSREPTHLVPQLASLANREEGVRLAVRLAFSRDPSVDELDSGLTYVAKDDASHSRWQQLVWSLLASAEFRFNH